uniref:Uncharacterized protein n=1 Tax=Glossina palpalis gambiensis TaxID=67801 RepID=A0A1B0BEZ4_9MUSC
MFYKNAFLIVKLIVLLSTLRHSVAYGVTQHCYNPNGRLGRCISVYECETILKIFVHQQADAYEFARKSECANGQGTKPYVCCTADTGFTDRTEYRGHRVIFPSSEEDDTRYEFKLPDGYDQKLTQTDLFPKHPNCGHVTISNKIYGGEEAELTEFAWLANLEYKTLHENFQSITSDGIRNYNDIALIRTSRDIPFKDSIQPVCLPDVDLLSPLRAGMSLTVAGWGHNGTVKYTNEKRKVDVPYVENHNCRLKVSDSQLCAGGVYMKDSCTGDSGGALMRISPSGWIIEGIVSYGRGCGLEQPAVYTRVRKYIQWIRDNVVP